MESLVSIIVPIFNVEEYLPQCVDSILAQSYTNLDIILVDDGSTDNSGAIAGSYSDHRIRFFHTENHGLSSARNLGIEMAKGEYISFIDADDWIEPNLLSNAMLQIGSADIICFGFNNHHYPSASYTGDEARIALLTGKLPGAAWSKLYRRECFKTVRFPDGRIFEDTITTIKLFLQSQKVKCLDMCAYHYRYRDGSITKTFNLQNIVDFWWATRQLFCDCINLVDGKAKGNLYKYCATAIIRTWAWRNSIPELKEETNFYEEISIFSCKYLSDLKYLPFHLRIGLFLTRHPCELSFLLANNTLHLYRWSRSHHKPME